MVCVDSQNIIDVCLYCRCPKILKKNLDFDSPQTQITQDEANHYTIHTLWYKTSKKWFPTSNCAHSLRIAKNFRFKRAKKFTRCAFFENNGMHGISLALTTSRFDLSTASHWARAHLKKVQSSCWQLNSFTSHLSPPLGSRTFPSGEKCEECQNLSQQQQLMKINWR